MATPIKYQYRDLHDPAARQVYDDPSDTHSQRETKRQTPPWNEEANAPASQRYAWPLPASYRWVLDLVLALVIAFLLWDRSNQKANCGPWQSTGDITGFAPRSKQSQPKPVVFVLILYSVTAGQDLQARHGLCSRERVRLLHRGSTREVAQHYT